MKPCNRKVYEVTYRVTKSPTDEVRGSMRILAASGLAAANAVDAAFPAWWSGSTDCKDRLTVEGVQGVVQDIRFEVES